jgi:hypothetical protein
VTVAAPFITRTDDERRAALLIANDVRARRVVLRAGIRSGDVSVTDVILDPPEYARTMKVAVVLAAIPKFGPVKVRLTLEAIRISKSRTLGGLSWRQRRDLVTVLGGDPSSVRPGRGV